MLKPTPFAVHVDPTAVQAVRVRVEGELDLATAPELKDVLEDQLQEGNDIVLDLSGVEFVDSSGLQAILASLKTASTMSGTLTISSSMPAQVHRLLEIAGVLSALPLVDG